MITGRSHYYFWKHQSPYHSIKLFARGGQVEVYEIRVNGIADGITETANKNGIGEKRGI